MTDLAGVDTYDMLGGLSPLGQFDTIWRVLESAEATEGFDPIPLADALTRAVRRLRFIRQHDGRVFFVGNGASAAIADHMAADFLKAGRMAAQTFSAPALMTCLGNDLGYEHVYSEPILRHGRAADVLVAISSSGKSPNILKAVEAANKRFMIVMSFTGFSPNNPLRRSGHLNFWVPSDKYGTVEVAHHAILHSILDRLAAE